MTSPAAVAKRVADAIRAKNAVFLAGAGTSMVRKTGAPGWAEWVREILVRVSDKALKPVENTSMYIPDASRFVQPEYDKLFNEVLFQIMSCDFSVGFDSTYDLVKRCLGTENYSGVHSFLSWTANEYDAKILTTNFDELIQHAGLNTPHEERIIHLHGKLSDRKSLRFTFNHVFSPLDTLMQQQVGKFISDRTLVVVGYQGNDKFDVMPAIFESNFYHPREVIWIQHPGAKPVDEKIQTRFLESKKVDIVTLDADDLFKQVYTTLKELDENSPRNKELDTWGPEILTEEERLWWKLEVEKWARLQSTESMQIVWARLLHHIKLFNATYVDSAGDIEKQGDMATHAFTVLELCAENPLTRARAKRRLYAISHETGKDVDVHQVKELIDQIDQDILRGRITENEISECKAMTMILLGQVLQNKREFKSAHDLLLNAIYYTEEKCPSQIPFAEFQCYMNSYLAKIQQGDSSFLRQTFRYRVKREYFASYLRSEAKTRDDIIEGATLCHNAGYVWYSLARDDYDSNANILSLRNCSRALEMYSEASSVRFEVHDPDGEARSKCRMAEVRCLQVLAGSKIGKDTAWLRERRDKAFECAKAVKQLFKFMPVERYRHDDLQHIFDSIKGLSKRIHSMEAHQIRQGAKDWRNRIMFGME